jgi:dolichol kinase
VHTEYHFRDCQDDGLLTGLLLGPLIAAALLYSSLRQMNSLSSPDMHILPASWLIEHPAVLHNSQSPAKAVQALVLARRNLVDISTICSALLLAHVSASWWYESQFVRNPNAPEGERASVPRREGRKFWLYILFIFSSTLGILCLRAGATHTGLGIWQSTFSSPLDVD